MEMSHINIIPTPKSVTGEHGVTFSYVRAKAKICTDCQDFYPFVASFITYAKKIHDISLTEEGGLELIVDKSLSAGEYKIVFTTNETKIYASDTEGAAYALASALHIMKHDGKEGEFIYLARTTITDKPDCDSRALRQHPRGRRQEKCF